MRALKSSFFLVVFLLFSAASFAESIQQYNKIYLSPFYRNTMTNNQNVTYYVTVNPPDRISSVLSAIISFDIYLTPSVNFTLWVNNKTCNNPSFFVSTTYSSSGQARISFDCSNIITDNATYEIKLRPSGANTGAVTGWLDLTYMNNPSGSVLFAGTDYFKGERATIFLQLKNSQGDSVDNAICSFSMYNTTNPMLSLIYNRQPMVFSGKNGIYYYQFDTSNMVEGVYPLDAECVYSFHNKYYYDDFQEISVITNSGTFVSGSSYNLNSPIDGLYMKWTGQTNITYIWNNVTGNISGLDFYWMGENSVGRTITFRVWNFTSSSWIIIGSVTTGSTGSTDVPTGVNSLFTSRLPTCCVWNGTTVIINEVQNGVGTKYVNWVTLNGYRNISQITDVKGSGEVHVYPINLLGLSEMVWNYSNRTLTYYNTSELLEKIKNINSTFVNVTINASITEESMNYLLEDLLARNYFFDYLESGEKDKNYCISQNVSMTVRELEICRNSACKKYNATYLSDCIGGCDEKTGKCKESLQEMSGWILVIVIIMVFFVLKVVGF